METSLAAILDDNISERYCARSKDDSLSQKEREAARLVVEAEAAHHDEQIEKCSEKAKAALELFRELGDEVGIADVTRLVVHGLVSQEQRKEGNRIAREELERIRAGTDRRGEGKLLLAVAEVNSERRGNKNRAEAKEYATEALKIFEREGDRLMQAYARTCLLNIQMKSREDRQSSCRKGIEYGTSARALFKACGSRRGEALALHGIAIVHVRADMAGCVISGYPGGWLAAATEAARIFKECKWFKMFVFEKVCIAQWMLGIDSLQARKLAEEALRLCKEHKSRHEFSALNVLVQSYIAAKDISKDFVTNEARIAIDLATQGLQRFKQLGNRMGEASSLHMLVLTYQATDEKHEAMKHAAQAADIYKEIGEKGGETAMLQALSQMHLDEREPEKAFQVAQEVADMNISLHETAVAQETLFEAHMQQGDLDAALKTAEELVLRCSDRNDSRREAIARLMICNVHYTQQNFTEAVLVAREAQCLLHDAGAWTDEGIALRAIAEVYLANNQFKEALKAAERAARLLRGRKKSEESACLIMIAQLRLSMLSQESMQRRRGSSAFAAACTDGIKAADAAVAFARQTKLRSAEGRALIIAGHVQNSALQPHEALKTAEEAMVIFEEVGDHRQQAHVMCLQADAHLANDNADRALVLVNKALAIFQDLGDRRGEWTAMQILEQITGPPELEPPQEVQPVGQEQWTPEQWAQWNEWQRQQAKVGGKDQQGPPTQLQKAQANQRQSRAVTGDKLNMSNLSVDSVRNRLNEIVKATVGLEDSETFDLDQPLMQVGITSRSAVELRNTLTEEIPGVDLPFTLIFDYPSVASISDMVLDSLGGVG